MDSKTWKQRLQDPKELVDWAKVASLISLLLGSLVVVIYAASIQHLPPLDFRTSIGLIVAIFAIGVTLFFGLVSCYVAPALAFRSAMTHRSEFSDSKRIGKTIVMFVLFLLIGQCGAVCAVFVVAILKLPTSPGVAGLIALLLVAVFAHRRLSRRLTSRESVESTNDIHLVGQAEFKNQPSFPIQKLSLEGHIALFSCLTLPMLFIWSGAIYAVIYWSSLQWISKSVFIILGALVLDIAFVSVALWPYRNAIRFGLILAIVVAVPIFAYPLSVATLRLLGIGDLHGVSLLVAAGAEPLLRNSGIQTTPTEDPQYRLVTNVHLLLHLGSEYVIAPPLSANSMPVNSIQSSVILPESLVKAMGWNLPEVTQSAVSKKINQPVQAGSIPEPKIQ